MCGEKLGVPLASRPFIKAELYKLLLYEEGAHFKPHRDIEEIFHSHTKLKKMVNLDGSEVANDVDIDETDMVQPVAFEEQDPDDEDYQGHTGNAGAEKTLGTAKQ